jgi:predicted NUDIX family NTP pyrophosphohydrolase
MSVESAGLLMYRINKKQLEVFLVHPGGPFFRNKDEGWWTIPKGIPDDGEELLKTAIREFKEETGITPSGPYHFLGYIRQKGGKVVHGWAFEGHWNPQYGITCNDFEIEWPPKSGKMKKFPEIDKADWLTLQEAHQKINQQQRIFLIKIEEILGSI